MYRPMQAPSSNGSSELTIIFLFVLFLLIVSSTAAGIYFYTREETNCNKIEKSYDCKFNDNCKWNEDDSECEYDTDTDTDSDTDSDTGVPYQIPLSTDDYCNDWGKIHQDVPECGRICSSEYKHGIKKTGETDYTWSQWDNSAADISSECMTASKIDKIWEVQSGSSSNRKLADGYTLSNYPVGTSVKCDKNDLNGEADGASASVYQVSEPGTLRHYPSDIIAASWDTNWKEWKTIGDCKGLTLGDDLESKDAGGGDAGGGDTAAAATPPTAADGFNYKGDFAAVARGKWNLKITGFDTKASRIFYLKEEGTPGSIGSLVFNAYTESTKQDKILTFTPDSTKKYFVTYAGYTDPFVLVTISWDANGTAQIT